MYELGKVTVFVCPDCGFNYGNVLAPDTDPSEVSESSPDPTRRQQHRDWISENLESNSTRFENHVNWVSKYVNIEGSRVLDIGCGGGRFLGSLKELGANVVGVELNRTRAAITREKYGIEVEEYPIEDEFWDTKSGQFDVVTLWDVIEHVNFPVETLIGVKRVLREGGFVLMDTPRRESLYYRIGDLTYRLSGGRNPTFLKGMYGHTPYGHKQIFSHDDMRSTIERAGLELIRLEAFKELSMPVSHYVKKLVAGEAAQTVVIPIAKVAAQLAQVKNKMCVVATKGAAATG